MGRRFAETRAADRAGMRVRTFTKGLGEKSVGNFRRQKRQVEAVSSPHGTASPELKSKTRARDDARIVEDDKQSPWDIEGKAMGLPYEPTEEDRDLTEELVPGVTLNGNGHKEDLFGEEPVKLDMGGPIDISGINQSEVYTLYDASDPELSLPEGGFNLIDKPNAYAIPPHERFR